MNPLRAHLASCEGCRAEFEALREVSNALERLPHFAPSPLFAMRVMSQVQVFEPWHVAARQSVLRWLPQSTVGRSLAYGTGGVMALTMTVLTIWLARRADAVLFLGSLVAQRSRDAALGAIHGIAVSTLGQSAASTMQSSGTMGLMLAFSGAAVAVLATAYGLKSLASATRGRKG